MKTIEAPIQNLLKTFIHEYPDWPIKGVKYFDINPLYQNAMARSTLITACIEQIESMCASGCPFDHIAVIESRGFLIGSIIADKLNKGLVLVRNKPGRLPGEFCFREHLLEYGNGRVEVQKGSGDVLLFDDVIATGGTSQAAKEALTDAGYRVIGAQFLVELAYCSPKFDIPYCAPIQYEVD